MIIICLFEYKKDFRLICQHLFDLRLVVQYLFFFSAPKPSNVQHVIATKCVDRNLKGQRMPFHSRDGNACDRVSDFVEAEKKNISASEIVFTFQFPLPRDKQNLRMSRWFQHIISVLYVDVEDSKELPFSKAYRFFSAVISFCTVLFQCVS